MTDFEDDRFAEQPWYRMADESAKAYDAFECYLELGSDRSLRKVAEHKTVDSGLRWIKTWSSEYHWVDRVEAWDRHMMRKRAEARELKHLEQLEEFAERQRELNMKSLEASILCMGLANDLMEQAKDEEGKVNLQPRDIPQFLRAAAHVSEAASNAQANLLAVDEVLKELDTYRTD